jgi:hypothetical protein
MKYFVNLKDDYWTAKNGLDRDLKKIARAAHGTLIDGKIALESFEREFRASMNDAEYDNKSCKPKELVKDTTGLKNSGSETIRWYVSNVFELEIIPVQREVKL